MKKRGIPAVSLIILVLVFALGIGWALKDKTEGLKLGRYVIQDAVPEGAAWVLLEENNQFEFNRSFNMSYRPKGSYSIEGKMVTLYDGEDAYVFTFDRGKLIFESGEKVGGLVKKGAIFKLSEEK